MLERDPAVDRNLYTDEYYPSMQLAIAWTLSTSPAQRALLRRQLLAQIELLGCAFGNRNGLMLKAPHYVFGIPAYLESDGPALQLIYVHRNPFSIAASMLKHPHLSRQLREPVGRCVDFAELGVLHSYASAHVLSWATARWEVLSPLERALFVWYLYARAFLSHAANQKLSFLVLLNESFGEGQARRLGGFLGIPDEDALQVQSSYRALPPADVNASSLGIEGQRLWSLMQSADAELVALARGAALCASES